jgi:hypothetical protein
MSTSDKYVALTEKRLLGWQSLKEQLFDYFTDQLKDLQMTYFSRSGTFSNIDFAGDGPNEFKLIDYLTTKVAALDGFGNLLAPVNRPTDVEDIPFANTLGTNYHVGIQRADIPSGFHINPADGMPFFDSYEEIIGYVGIPDLVSSDGMGGLSFRVDSITSATSSHQGRRVVVWKVTPGKEAQTEADAIEECTVVYLFGHNGCGTAGTFGQGSTISTTPSDYRVALVGPRVSTVSLVSDPECCYIGYITGAGFGVEPTVWDTTDQYVIDVSLVQLSEITRTEPSNGRLKIDVKALAPESGIDQIRVTKLGTGIVFQVDEDGNVEIQGDLIVRGTEQVHDTETIYSSETITGNLTAGDDDAIDSHLIKGTWKHSNTAGTANYFIVDGATGKIGIGALPSGTDTFQITGTTLFTGDISVNGTLAPSASGKDLGDTTHRWDLYGALVQGGTNVETLVLNINKTIGGTNVFKADASGDYVLLSDGVLRLKHTAGAGEGNWGFQVDEISSKEVLSLSTYNDSWVKTGLILKAQRGTDTTTVERVDFAGDVYIDVANHALMGDHGTSSIGQSGNRWPLFYGTTVNINAMTINTGISPDAASGAYLGSIGTYFSDVYSSNLWSVNGGLFAYNSAGVSNQRNWKIGTLSDGDLWAYMSNDAGAAIEGILQFKRVTADHDYFHKMVVQSAYAGGPHLQLRHVGNYRFDFASSAKVLYISQNSDDDSVSDPLMEIGYSDSLVDHYTRFIRQVIVDQIVYPSTDGLRDLGKTGARFKDIFCANAKPNKLTVGTGAGNGSETLEPITNDVSRTLGSASYPWYRGYIERLTLGVDSGEGMNTDILPVADATYAIGSATLARRFTTLDLETRLRIFKDSAADIKIQFGSNSASDGVNWEFRASSGGVLNLYAMESDFGTGSVFMQFNRTALGTTPESIVAKTVVETPRSLVRAASGGAYLDLRADAAAADKESWRIKGGTDGTLNIFMAPDDFSGDGNLALRLVRDSAGTSLEEVWISDGADIVPTDAGSDIGSETYFFNKTHSNNFVAIADSASAGTGLLNIGKSVSSGSGGNGTLGAAGGNANAGFLKWYLGSSAIYIPYWSAIT